LRQDRSGETLRARKGKARSVVSARVTMTTARASATQRVHSDTHSSYTATERYPRLRRCRELSPPFRRDALVDLLVRELVDQELTDSVCIAQHVSEPASEHSAQRSRGASFVDQTPLTSEKTNNSHGICFARIGTKPAYSSRSPPSEAMRWNPVNMLVA
jgi:hypothetical protein